MLDVIDLLKKTMAETKKEIEHFTKDADRWNTEVINKLKIADENDNIVKFLKEKLSEGNIPFNNNDQYGPLWQFEQAANTARLLANSAKYDAGKFQGLLEKNQKKFDELERAIKVLQNAKEI